MENDKYYKWYKDNDIYTARVIMGTTACYYKNGEPYALYKPFVLQDTDIEITQLSAWYSTIKVTAELP